MSESFARDFGVLVADDDLRSRDSVATLLALEGFRTEEAAGGRVALEFIRRQFRGLEEAQGPAAELTEASVSESPARGVFAEGLGLGAPPAPVQRVHFLVLDYNMPDLTGLEVLRQLRGEPGMFIPSILMSGEASEELERAVLEAGGFALIPKPVEPVFFRRLVWKLVRRHFNDF